MAKGTISGYVDALDPSLRDIAAALVPAIDEVLPGAGDIWHGHPLWSLGPAPGKNPVCLIKAYSSYLTFGIFRGREITDLSGRLDTKGGLAHVKLRGTDDVDAALFTGWLRQARDLEAAAT